MGAAGSPGAQVVGPDRGHRVEQNATKKLEARVVEEDTRARVCACLTGGLLCPQINYFRKNSFNWIKSFISTNP